MSANIYRYSEKKMICLKKKHFDKLTNTLYYVNV